MNHNHLSAAEVAIFREETLSSRSIEIGRHLLTCRECRTKLPSVTPQELRNCVLDTEIVDTGTSESRSRLFQFDRFPGLSVARATVVAGFAILLLVGLYLVRVQSGFTNSAPIVAKGDTSPIQLGSGSPDSRPVANPTSTDSQKPKGQERKDGYPERPRVQKRPTLGKGKLATKVPAMSTSETRGNGNPCSGDAMINLESNTNGKEIFLKWNSIKGASSYDIYISDLDENLLDHFETDSQTQYRSNVKLEPEKTYRWKLIITLSNGNKIVGPPQILKPGVVLDSKIKTGTTEKQRGTFAVRCVEAK